MKTGVYFCNCSGNISGQVNSETIKDNLQSRHSGAYFKTCELLCSEEGINFLEEDLKENAPDRVLVMACSPRDHENTFMNALKRAGINPYYLQMVNIREHVAWVTPDGDTATQKTIRCLEGALQRVLLHEPLEMKQVEASLETLVIGAGPAGLSAALKLAEAGRKVTLVEKTPFIGGMPVRYEEIFPHLECGPCMLEGMMDRILHNDFPGSIELLTMAEVTEVVGSYGNFTARIKQYPRFVEEKNCLGCDLCVEACPVTTPNEFNLGMGEKKAISPPLPGALPYVPYLDPKACLRWKEEECSLCQETCLVEGAINFEQTETTVERNAGAIILATGFSLYPTEKLGQLGYEKVNSVYHSLEFERIAAENGPTEGQIITREGSFPQKVAIVHCAGSLEEEHAAYCSGVCCAYALKFNLMINKKLPETEIVHFFKELTLPGAEDYELYKRVKDNPLTSFIRYHSSSDLFISEKEGRPALQYVDQQGATGNIELDMVILCPPMVPGKDTVRLANLLEVTRGSNGFLEALHGKMEATQSNVKGIFIAGACQSPKDIKAATTDGASAAGNILSALVEGRKLDISPVAAEINRDICSGCKVCLSICPFKAVSFDEENKTSQVNELLCQGCGTCAAACPSGAARGKHFTDRQITAEIKGVLRNE